MGRARARVSVACKNKPLSSLCHRTEPLVREEVYTTHD